MQWMTKRLIEAHEDQDDQVWSQGWQFLNDRLPIINPMIFQTHQQQQGIGITIQSFDMDTGGKDNTRNTKESNSGVKAKP